MPRKYNSSLPCTDPDYRTSRTLQEFGSAEKGNYYGDELSDEPETWKESNSDVYLQRFANC
jgi:hypothetical protein